MYDLPKKSKRDDLCTQVHFSDAESRREIPFFLVSFRKRRVSLASELQHSNADSLFDFRRRIHSEFVLQDHLVCLLTVAPISDHPRLSFGLI